MSRRKHSCKFVVCAILLVSSAWLSLACNSTDINTPNHFNRPHRNPSITVDCPASVGENAAATCTLTARNNDLYARFLTCSLNTATTCTGVTLTGCTSANVPAQGEDRGSRSCSVVVDVKDDYSPPHSGQGSDTITIDEDNQNPTISGDCPDNFGENSAATCVLTVSDWDLPLQTLTCSSGGTNCVGFTPEVSGSGGNPQNCTISFTSAQPQVCSLRVVGTDNGSPALSVGQTITITVPNSAPTWSTAPVATTCASGSTCGPTVNGILTDPNAGQTLSCVAGSSTCTGTGVMFTYAGSGAKPVSCNLIINATAAAPQTCNLRLTGADNGTPSLTVGTTVAVTISNQAPRFSTLPVATTCASGSTCGPTINGILTDPNAGQTLSCVADSSTCTGTGVTFTYAGSGAKPVSCNLTINATAAAPQTCNLRVTGADNGTPSLTVGTTVAITISNQAPTFSTLPVATSCVSGTTCGPTVNGIVTDPNAGQTLSCVADSSTCTGTGVTFTYAGSGAKPVSCNLTINATAAAPQSCNLRVTGADNGTPSLTVGTTVAVTISNQAPTFSTLPVATTCASGSTCGPAANGVATDDSVPAQTLTCSATADSCTGVTFTYAGSSTSPVTCKLTVNASAAAPQSCNLRVQVADSGSPSLTVGATISVTISNRAPRWQTAPTDITISGGSLYNQTNGTASDNDFGQLLTCSSNGTSCVGFTPEASGFGPSPLSCDISFTAPLSFAQCNLRICATDNGSPALSVGRTIAITTNHRPTWQTAPTNITISSGSIYNSINGVLADEDTGQLLTCLASSDTCEGISFSYSGSGPNPVNCQLSFTAGWVQRCNMRLVGSDNYDPAATIGRTIILTINVPGWVEVGAGSASGGGISNNLRGSLGPSLALDPIGNPVLAWSDYGPGGGPGNSDIYVKRWDGSSWADVGTGSYSGGGISNNSGLSNDPSLALDSFGNPVVAWSDNASGNWEIYVKRWDGSAWVDVGTGSSSGGGISNNSGASYNPSLALDSLGYPVVAWHDFTLSYGGGEIYIKRWNGSAWVEVGAGSSSGGGISNNNGESLYPSLALDSLGKPVLAWENWASVGNHEIYIKRWTGSAWVDVGTGSSSGGGISNNSGYSLDPSLALNSLDYPFVAWTDYTYGNGEIYILRWNGSAWVGVGPGSASFGGISNNDGESLYPSLAIDHLGNPVVAWSDDTSFNWEIYIKRWENDYAWVDVGAGSSSNGDLSGGISNNSGISSNPSLAVDLNNNPFVAWDDSTSGDTEIYIKRRVP